MKSLCNGTEYWVGSHKLLKDYRAYLSDVLGDMLVEYESEETASFTSGVRMSCLP